jgi:hypothetical protein
MVEGDDRTDRSSACGGPGDDSCQPDGPEHFDWYVKPQRPSKPTRNQNPFPAPRLAMVHKIGKQVITRILYREPLADVCCAATSDEAQMTRLDSCRRS